MIAEQEAIIDFRRGERVTTKVYRCCECGRDTRNRGYDMNPITENGIETGEDICEDCCH